MLHGLLGNLILVGLLAIGIAFTYAVAPHAPRIEHWVTCDASLPVEQC